MCFHRERIAMQLFEGYNAAELHRVLTASRWIAGLLILLAVAAVAVNQWLVHRIATQQKLERDSGNSRLMAAEDELRRLRSQISSVASTVDKITSTRRISPAKVAELKNALEAATKGKILITYLTIEWEAEDYAKQLSKILTEAGYHVTLSDHLWVTFEHGGTFLTSQDGTLPSYGAELQRAFAKIGVEAPLRPAGEIGKELALASGEVVLVVGSR
jgi:hypothetical protein